MERLSQLIEISHREGQWRAFPITRRGTNLTHLMFADDTVLFGEASKAQALVIDNCLKQFCAVSGQLALRSQVFISLQILVKW